MRIARVSFYRISLRQGDLTTVKLFRLSNSKIDVLVLTS